MRKAATAGIGVARGVNEQARAEIPDGLGGRIAGPMRDKELV